MIPEYFTRTPVDEQFYVEKLAPRLPKKILDMHIHIAKPEFHKNVDPYQIEMDWAQQCSGQLPFEEMMTVVNTMFPTVTYEVNALGTVTKGADFVACNQYLAQLLREGKARFSTMTLDPHVGDAETERTLLENGFIGFKPYPDMISGQKGADIGLYDFVPPSKLEILNRNKRTMTLHIPRAGRLADPKNVEEIKRAVGEYPDIKLIIAHFGRAYTLPIFEKGARMLGDDVMRHLYFDFSAVLNPEVLTCAMEVMDRDHIFYGTDLPVFQWHGRRRWTDTMYYNLVRESFPWKKESEGAEVEAGYTFFLYEQMNNALNVFEKTGGQQLIDNILYNNAFKLCSLALEG